jgi:hypothetical protein
MSHIHTIDDSGRKIYFRNVPILDDDMTRVEIRWMEEVTHDGINSFSGFIEKIEDMDAPSSVEKVFQEWLEDRVKGKSIVVTDLEIYVDGKFYPLSREEEEQYMIRIGSSSNSR